MAHGYHTLQNWNQWLHRDVLGNNLLDVEQKFLQSLLDKHFGKHVVLLGVPQQRFLLSSSILPAQTLISPLAHREEVPGEIEANFKDIPVLSGTVDLVLVPHTLEFVDNPRHLLSEACRIVKPEGLIVVLGFNPISMWGLKRVLTRHKVAPWTGNFISAQQVKSWLGLFDFELEKQKATMHRPPVGNGLFKKLAFMETVGRMICPIFGGVYVMVARAKVIPLTPIRMQWKQRLTGFRITPSITGTIARRAK